MWIKIGRTDLSITIVHYEELTMDEGWRLVIYSDPFLQQLPEHVSYSPLDKWQVILRWQNNLYLYTA